jgi:integrase/recombinase XerD
MLTEFFPRVHARFSSLVLLGPHVDGFVVWLDAQGFPRRPICLRVRELPRIEELLRLRGIRRIGDLSAAGLRALGPRRSQEDIYRAATVTSLVRYFDHRGLLAPAIVTPREELVAAYRTYLKRVRGFATSTSTSHGATAREFLTFLGYDDNPDALSTVGSAKIESFQCSVGQRLSRASLQHTIGHLRSFLRFLASRDIVDRGLDTSIYTPRLYRGEQLPRTVSWETVQAFLAAIDRSTPMGRRDYAMFLLISTYGLRTSEVAGLRLDDVEWRAERLCVRRPKIKTPLVLPLTPEVGAALVDYLRHARPNLSCREMFLRVRAPAGKLKPTAVTEAFQCWTRRSGLPIPHQGPHCLRHSLAVHLLRCGAPLTTIGDLLGHRSAESTCVYLRLHVEDLRDAALDLPGEAQA